MPHEWLMANATGLATGAEQIAWAAWQAQSDEPCAWFTLCHLSIGIDQVSLQMSDELCIAPEHDQALLIAMQTLAANDGIALTSIGPGRWLAKGLPLADLATASIDRVANQALTPWLPTGTHANTIRRLQSEAQMLFYTHPVQDERQAQGLPSINSFWISGSGTTPQPVRQIPPPQHLHVETALRLPALQTDWLAWQTAWQQFDAGSLAECTARVNQGQGMQLSLCGRHGHFDIAIDAHPQHLLAHVANGYQYLVRKLTKPMSLHALWQKEATAAH
jgi:hypothetical protein